MTDIKVSVVIPAFNSAKTIERAMNSVFAQSLLPNEIIVIDDASTDQTFEVINAIIESYHGKVAIKLHRNVKNQGPSRSRNLGINKSACEWIAFLDADDIWHPKRLEIQSDIIHDSKTFLVGSCVNIYPEGHKEIVNPPKTYTVRKKDLLFKNYFATSTILVKKTSDLNFNESMGFSEDFDLWLRMVNKWGEAIYIDFPLGTFGKPPYLHEGLSSNLIKMEKGELRAISKEKNLLLRYSAYIFSVLKFIRRAAKAITYRILTK